MATRRTMDTTGAKEVALEHLQEFVHNNAQGESVLDELAMYDLSASMLRPLPGARDSFQGHVFDTVVDLLRDAFSPDEVVFDEFRDMSHAFFLRRSEKTGSDQGSPGRVVACMILTPSTSADEVSGMSMNYVTMARDAPINARELLIDSAKIFLWVGIVFKRDLPLEQHCSNSADRFFIVALNRRDDIDFAAFLEYMGFERTAREWAKMSSGEEAWEFPLSMS